MFFCSAPAASVRASGESVFRSKPSTRNLHSLSTLSLSYAHRGIYLSIERCVCLLIYLSVSLSIYI
jgi:hypothetical protein